MSDSAAAAASAAPASTGAESTGAESQELAAEGTEGIIEDDASDVLAEEAKATEEALKNLKRKYNVKANGKSREIELDLSNDKQIQEYLSKAAAADEKFEEAANMRKAVEELVRELKSNPKAILSHPSIGLDLKTFAQSIMDQELEDMSKTPEQKRIEEMEQKLKQYEEDKKKLEEEKTTAERARIQEEQFQKLDEQITDALSKSELPKSPYVLKRIADTMIEAVNLGYTDVSVEQILPYVEQQIVGEINRLFEEAPSATAGKLMEKLVGKKNLDSYRKARVSKAKTTASASTVKDSGASSKTAEKKEDVKPVRFKDMFGRF